MTSPLFHVSLGSLDDVAPGDRFALEGAEGHHAAKVMRLGPGEHVLLSDTGTRRARAVVLGPAGSGSVPSGATGSRSPKDGGAGARSGTAGRGSAREPAALELELIDVLDDAAQLPRLVLVQALAKDKRDLQAVESATELGVDAVIPWQAERCVVRWKPSAAARKHEEWTSLVAAASKQSRRTSVPQVRSLQSTEEYAACLREHADVAVLVLDESGAKPISSAVAELGLSHGGDPGGTSGPEPGADIAELHLVVGPEGGISATELAALAGPQSLAARLGPTVLRASSAGAAALTAVNVLLGRWDGPSRDENQRVE